MCVCYPTVVEALDVEKLVGEVQSLIQQRSHRETHMPECDSSSVGLVIVEGTMLLSIE